MSRPSRRRVLFPGPPGADPRPLSPDDITPLPSIDDYTLLGPLYSPLTQKPVESPTQALRTPHDLSDNTKFPKLIRASRHEGAPPPDCRNPRIRTALFPEVDMSVSSSCFYPKQEKQVSLKTDSFRTIQSGAKKHKKKERGMFLCNRRGKFRATGQINRGVRHKIRKRRKIKKIKNVAILQAAINIIENSPLNSVLPPLPKQSAPPTPPRSPTPPPDPTKKFFKTSRHRGTVTVNSNIKLEMNRGKLSLIKKANKRTSETLGGVAKKAKLVDLDTDQRPMIAESEVNKIIHQLDGEKENEIGELLMSPTSQMVNMASGLALNSPKKARDLTGVLEALPNNDKKYFPVFYPGRTAVPPTKEKNPNQNVVRKMRGLSKDQMLLDAGQKKWGATQCPECKIIYHQGDPSDEIMHLNYHNAVHVFRFGGWKNERVVSDTFLDGRIIQIIPGDPKIWWKKVKEVMMVVNRDLGYYDIEFNTANSQIFLYIKNRTIVGCLVAESKSTAFQLLTTPAEQVDLCSEESYPIKCGVSRIWVSNNWRKKGIATALMDSLKRNFMYGMFLENADVAFSSPTEMGKIFGNAYFKTAHFLIYFV